MPHRLVVTCNGKPVVSFEEGEATWRARAIRDAHYVAQIAAGVSPSTLDYQVEDQSPPAEAEAETEKETEKEKPKPAKK